MVSVQNGVKSNVYLSWFCFRFRKSFSIPDKRETINLDQHPIICLQVHLDLEKTHLLDFWWFFIPSKIRESKCWKNKLLNMLITKKVEINESVWFVLIKYWYQSINIRCCFHSMLFRMKGNLLQNICNNLLYCKKPKVQLSWRGASYQWWRKRKSYECASCFGLDLQPPDLSADFKYVWSIRFILKYLFLNFTALTLCSLFLSVMRGTWRSQTRAVKTDMKTCSNNIVSSTMLLCLLYKLLFSVTLEIKLITVLRMTSFYIVCKCAIASTKVNTPYI